jgi:hypothetical protein
MYGFLGERTKLLPGNETELEVQRKVELDFIRRLFFHSLVGD